jgi:hypothetical protein
MFDRGAADRAHQVRDRAHLDPLGRQRSPNAASAR